MMNLSKLQLSEEETAMVMDSHWLLTKNSIMQKAYALFGESAGWLQENVNRGFKLPEEVLIQSPKIARGENYNGLPYVMLDYPRFFGKEDVFALRTMFWWGNFLSITWHLKGRYGKLYRRNLISNYERLAVEDFQLCIGEDEWRHDFNDDNYLRLQNLDITRFSAELADKSFNKLAVKISLDQWNNAKIKLIRVYQTILDVASINYPGDEKDLLPDNPITDSDL
ncbi:MAG TPA: hypothetical protein VK616_10905 [Flavitalea sp.]|nr:hypothetical protein [Flavitalea sp.]HTF27558.1 hypothetical protein [Flavitalea sp.]